MRYFVNSNCIGCGLCTGICPELFTMGDAGLAVAKEGDVPEELLDSAAEARTSCPVEAIEEA